jgi:NitT/TauT family transport system substrate-binding protein
MKKNLIIIFGFLIVFFVLIYFINKQQNIRQPKGIQKISLRLKWLNQAQFSGYYVANEKGLYKERGLEVTINAGGPDISPIQMVVSKVDDFGITGADQILLAREKGIPIVALAVIYKDTPVAIGSLKTKNIITPQDLKGKRMGVIYGRDEETIYRALLAKENIDKADVEEVSLLAGLSQLTTNKIDAQILYEINEPVLLAQQGFELNLIKPRDYGIKFYADTLFTTEDMIKKNPQAVKNFVQASIEGWRLAFKNPRETIKTVLSINTSLNKEHQTKFLELSAPLITNKGKIGYSEKEIWEAMQETLLNQNILKKSVDIKKVFTNKYLD